MADPSFAVQTLVRQRLVESPDVIALLPAVNVIDANARPEVFPVILLGEGQTTYRRFRSMVYLTLHVWTQEASLAGAKDIVSAIVDCVPHDAQIDGGILTADGFDIYDLSIDDTRYLRDPHGPYSHAVVTVSAIVKEVAS